MIATLKLNKGGARGKRKKPAPVHVPDLFAPKVKTPVFLYAGEPPHQKHSRTSKAAARGAMGKFAPQQERVIKFLKDNPLGATDEELMDGLGFSGNTLRPRRRSLELLGLVVNSGRTKPGRSGRQAVVWMLAENPAAPRNAKTHHCAYQKASEFGEYLALAAESFMKQINLNARDEEAGGPADHDALSDCWKGLESAIYEFRKRVPK